MSKQTAYKFQLDTELTDAFLDAARSAHREPEDVLAELVRDFVDQHTGEIGYQEFLRKKVETARKSISGGAGRQSGEVEALFEAMRKDIQKSVR